MLGVTLLKARVLAEATSLGLCGISLWAPQLLVVLIILAHPQGHLYRTLRILVLNE